MSQTQSPSSSSNIEHDQDTRAAFPNIEDYLAIKTACYADYNETLQHLPTNEELKECSKYLSEWPSPRVVDQWKTGEPSSRPQAVLEIAVRCAWIRHPCHFIPPAAPPHCFQCHPCPTVLMRPRRYMSGCTIYKVNPEGALYMLDAFHDPECSKSDYVGHIASQSDVARAHSCAAHAHYQKFSAPLTQRLLYASIERHYSRRQSVVAGFGYPAHTSFKFALHHASESARLGHVSSIVLCVGFAAREIGEGLGVDFSQHADRAKRYRPLWRAVDARLNELYAEARTALKTERRDSLEHVCGAERCGTRSKSSPSFKACSGKCPLDLKPRYYSKQCQVKVSPASVRD